MLRRQFLLLTPGLVLGCGATAANSAPLAVPAGVPRKGASQPELIVQEAGDYQCPFCGEAQPAVDALLERYGSRIALVWRDFPLRSHPRAHAAAQAAREVRAQQGDAAFWEFHARLFDADLSPAGLHREAARVPGLDLEAFDQALTAGVHGDAVDADKDAVSAHVDALGISFGTPGFFIGERVLVGSQPLEVLLDAVDRALG